MSKIKIEKDGLILDGKPFYLAAGDMHYFRFFPGGWRRRLELMKDFGLTAVQTYMAWNLHEPEPGKFDFSGMLDIEAFLKLCDEVGLKVILRCSPFMCSEWDLGGLPSWLLSEDEIAIRCSDETYMAAVERYSKEICRRIVPYLSTNGGPVILVGIENEYGSFGNDLEYIGRLAETYRENGIDVPFLTANGAEDFKLYNGTLREDFWVAMDSSAANIAEEAKIMRRFQPDKPLYIAEFWDGRRMQWLGGKFLPRDAKAVADYYRNSLDEGAFISFYMFCGGTNFGFMNGALIGAHLFAKPENNPWRYLPMMTSYDVNAAVTENGEPTEKYFALRDVLDEHLGRKKRPHIAPEYRTQVIADVKLTQSADFFKNVDALATKCIKSGNTKSMERLGQDYGFIMYSTFLRYGGENTYHLEIDGLHDRAVVFGDGKYLGTYLRDAKNEVIKFKIPKKGLKLDILVENLGRINYGKYMLERKGITGCVSLKVERPNGSFVYNLAMINNWTIRCLPLKDISGVRYENDAVSKNPAFFKGSFRAEPGVDTFLDMSEWKKGNVWINGFNLGRYWSVGSQQTLYVPGELLKEENTVEVFELHSDPNVNTLKFSPVHIFSEVSEEQWAESIK